MAKKVMHPIVNVDGRSMVLPAWKGGQKGYDLLAIPDIRDINATQLYPVGTKMLDGERVFYYAKASSFGVSKTDYGVKNGYRQHIRYGAVTAAVTAGDKEITITVNASDGVAGDGDIAINELAGGFVVVFNHDDDAFVCRILENTATDGGGDITLTLQDEIPVDLLTGNVDHAEAMAHWALGCEWNTDTEEPVVGVAHMKVTANYWFWLQTWGPCWLGPSSAGPCEAAHKHQVVFESTGEVDNHDDSSAILEFQQHAGFGLCHAIGGGQGAPFFMLQICP